MNSFFHAVDTMDIMDTVDTMDVAGASTLSMVSMKPLHAEFLTVASRVSPCYHAPFMPPCVSKLKALSDASRWRIVAALLREREPLSMSELATRLELSLYNLSKHIRILREAGILETRRLGKTVACRVALDLPKKRNGEPVLDLGCCTFRFSGEFPAARD